MRSLFNEDQSKQKLLSEASAASTTFAGEIENTEELANKIAQKNESSKVRLVLGDQEYELSADLIKNLIAMNEKEK